MIWGLAQSLSWPYSKGRPQENGVGVYLRKAFRDSSFGSEECPLHGEKLFSLRSISRLALTPCL